MPKHASGYRKGAYRVLCGECGFKKWSYQTRMRWDGMRVCSDTCWEPRHPQDFVAAPIDRQSVPNPRPEPSDSFTSGTELTWDDDAKAWS